MRVLQHLIYSNLYVALVLLFFTSNSFFFYDLPVNYPYSVLIAVLTFLLYTLHGLVGMKYLPLGSATQRHAWLKTNRKLVYFLAIPSVFLSLFLLSEMSFNRLLLLSAPTLIALLYVFPLFNGKRLRDLAYIKPLTIALVVCYLTCFLPGLAQDKFDVLFVLERLFLLLAVTLPFDVRDKIIDAKKGDRSLAVSLGDGVSFYLSNALLFASGLLNAHFYLEGQVGLAYMAFQILALSLALLFNLYHLKRKPQEWHYALIYEGSLLFPGFCLISFL